MPSTTLTDTPAETSGPTSSEALAATVVLAGFAGDVSDAVGAGLDVAVRVAADEAAVEEIFAGEEEIAVLCVGGEIVGERARDLVQSVEERHPEHRRLNVVLGAGPSLELFQDLVNDDRLFYLSQKTLAADDIARILRGALGARADFVGGSEEDDEEVLDAHRVLRLVDGIAREDEIVPAVGRSGEAVRELLHARRTMVYVYEPATQTLWGPAPGAEDRRESAAAGIVSFVLRTGTPVRLEEVGGDPRYDGEADNPGGSPEERFLAAPVIDPKDPRVWAVLVALRGGDEEPFSGEEEELLERFAEQVAPVLGRLVRKQEIEARADERHGVRGTDAGQIFREEALDHHLQGLDDRGHVLQISPAWTKWVYRLLVIGGLVAVVFSIVASVREYATGPAIVRSAGRTDITAAQTGTVVTVDVRPGERVLEGDLLVRLYGAQEAAELDRIRREFELGLLHRLRDPSDLAAERTLGALAAQKRLAEMRLEERSIRAPRDGIVTDVWVQPGHNLVPGQTILSLEGADTELGIIALLPGQFRPTLEPGMPIRFEIQGYSYAYQNLEVASIGDEAVGPTEARRVLGPVINDAVTISGPVVFVYARLPSETFESGGRTYAYHDGILGTAEVQVRSEPILLTLVPGLKVLWPDGQE